MRILAFIMKYATISARQTKGRSSNKNELIFGAPKLRVNCDSNIITIVLLLLSFEMLTKINGYF